MHKTQNTLYLDVLESFKSSHNKTCSNTDWPPAKGLNEGLKSILDQSNTHLEPLGFWIKAITVHTFSQLSNYKSQLHKIVFRYIKILVANRTYAWTIFKL